MHRAARGVNACAKKFLRALRRRKKNYGAEKILDRFTGLARD